MFQAELGRSTRRGHELPPDSFVYGISTTGDQAGAAKGQNALDFRRNGCDGMLCDMRNMNRCPFSMLMRPDSNDLLGRLMD